MFTKIHTFIDGVDSATVLACLVFVARVLVSYLSHKGKGELHDNLLAAARSFVAEAEQAYKNQPGAGKLKKLRAYDGLTKLFPKADGDLVSAVIEQAVSELGWSLAPAASVTATVGATEPGTVSATVTSEPKETPVV